MASSDDKSAAREDSCLEEYLPLFSAVLKWKTQPTGDAPSGASVWGDARLARIQTGSFKVISLPTDKIKLSINPGQTIPAEEPKMLTPAELHRLYAGTSVPRHRFLAPSLSAAASSPEIAPHPARWLAGISEIDLSEVVDAWLNTNCSTEYEQLSCIGLDPNTGQLTGVLTIKQGAGYSGGPSTAGSREFVAFWVDWGSGFQYQGTASVAVYDFGCLPSASLEYSVSLSADLLSHIRRCGGGARTVKVRAVLSWNTPPSTTDPKAPVVWGNILETRIPISTGHLAGTGNQVPGLAASGRAIDTAIKTLLRLAFGSHAARRTAASDSAIAGPGVSDQSFTTNIAVRRTAAIRSTFISGTAPT